MGDSSPAGIWPIPSIATQADALGSGVHPRQRTWTSSVYFSGLLACSPQTIRRREWRRVFHRAGRNLTKAPERARSFNCLSGVLRLLTWSRLVSRRHDLVERARN